MTVVKFPMWLWLDEPFTYAEAEALSNGIHVRVRGRATLDHVTWTLGDHELTCTLDDMQAYVPDSGMSPADRPPCHHVFTELVDYTMPAAVTYRIEQQVSLRRSAALPFPDPPWTAHPISEYVTIESSSGPISVEEIYSLNVPVRDLLDQVAATD